MIYNFCWKRSIWLELNEVSTWSLRRRNLWFLVVSQGKIFHRTVKLPTVHLILWFRVYWASGVEILCLIEASFSRLRTVSLYTARRIERWKLPPLDGFKRSHCASTKEWPYFVDSTGKEHCGAQKSKNFLLLLFIKNQRQLKYFGHMKQIPSVASYSAAK